MNNAFLNDQLREEFYMSQPLRFEVGDGSMVCKLKRAIYGLKQVPCAWFETLASTLVHFRFVASKCDPSLFIQLTSSNVIYILVYVDDILVTGSSAPYISYLKQWLNSQFALNDLGMLHYFLRVEVSQLSYGFNHLSQHKYVQDLLKKTGMLTAKGMLTPMVTTTKVTKTGIDKYTYPKYYRSVVGSLQYATLIRPDISYVVNRVCQFMSSPLEQHWVVVKCILRYLAATSHYGLVFRQSTNLSLRSTSLMRIGEVTLMIVGLHLVHVHCLDKI